MKIWVCLNHLLDGLSGVLLFALMSITFVDVAGRYMFNAPLPGGFEITEMVLALVIFAALPHVSARNEHVGVDLLDPLYSSRALRLRNKIMQFIGSVCLLGIAWRVGVKAYSLQSVGEISAILEVPMHLIAYFMSGMCVIAGILMLRNIFRK